MRLQFESARGYHSSSHFLIVVEYLLYVLVNFYLKSIDLGKIMSNTINDYPNTIFIDFSMDFYDLPSISMIK